MRLQCLACAMWKSVMPSAAKNGKVSKEKKRENLAVLAKTPRLKQCFLAKLSSNIKTVVLTGTPENVGQCFSTGVPKNMWGSMSFKGSVRVTGVGDGVQPHHQNFLFGENPGKICGNFGKICENVRKIAVCVCFDFTKMAPKIKVQTFFSFGGHVFILFFSGKLGEIWASSTMVLELCFDLNKCTQHEKICSGFSGGHFLWSFFRASLGKFG